MLDFDGIARMTGRAEVTDDYFDFCTEAALSNAQLNELHRATIEIDGRTEGVLVESTDWLDLPPNKSGMHCPLRLTLRRNVAFAVQGEKAPR